MSDSPNIPAPLREEAPLNCPFCGDEPDVIETPPYTTIECANIHCESTCSVSSSIDAIKIWNHRATPQPPAADVREMAQRITNRIWREAAFSEQAEAIITAELQPLFAELVEARAERDKLRIAITRAGFAVMQASGDWDIYDVSEKGKAADAKALEVANENVDLAVKVQQLEAERDRLKAIVDTLDRTLDGAVIVPTMEVFTIHLGDSSPSRLYVINHRARSESLEEYGCVNLMYSTLEAALASHAVEA